MVKRVFVAVNLSLEASGFIEKKLDELKRKTLPIEKNLRFVKSYNWHITISFLGYQDVIEMPKIMEAVKEITLEFFSPTIVFKRITYGPNVYNPRMIWLLTSDETSLNLGEIKNVFENNLERKGIKFKRENRPFNGHITLARINISRKKLKLPSIEETINFEFKAKSLDLMESILKRNGAEYNFLGKFGFKE